MDIFIAWDGDHIGREVGRASLADDVEGLRRISQNIDRGNQIWRSWVESHGGSLISMGGDEGRAQIPADYLDELPKIREQYAGAVDASVSVGVGVKLSEADQALLGAKLQGGDRIVFYTEEVGKQIEEARKKGEKTEEDKIADEYLNKAELRFKAAFRHPSGEVVHTGNSHRVDLLPTDWQVNPGVVHGFVDESGKFYDRKEALQALNRSDLDHLHSTDLEGGSVGAVGAPRFRGLNKAAPTAMNPGAFAGASRPSAATVDKPTPTQGDHSAGEVATDTFEESRPESPQMTHAAKDFEDHFHDAAADQEREDNKQAMASTKNIADVKQRLAQALMMLKQQAPLLEQMKQAAPDAYAAVTGLAQAVVGLAREVQGAAAPQPMSKAEPQRVTAKKHPKRADDSDMYRYMSDIHTGSRGDLNKVPMDTDFRLVSVPLDKLPALRPANLPQVQAYAKLSTPYPPIIIGRGGSIPDGHHRIAAARMRGDKFIRAYVPSDEVGNYEVGVMKKSEAFVEGAYPKTADDAEISDYFKSIHLGSRADLNAVPYDTQYELVELPVAELASGVKSDNARAVEYSQRGTPFPPIIMKSEGNQPLDGNHRVTAARLRGDETIRAYMPLRKDEPGPRRVPNPYLNSKATESTAKHWKSNRKMSERRAFDYSHLLPRDHQENGYKLTLLDHPTDNTAPLLGEIHNSKGQLADRFAWNNKSVPPSPDMTMAAAPAIRQFLADRQKMVQSGAARFGSGGQTPFLDTLELPDAAGGRVGGLEIDKKSRKKVPVSEPGLDSTTERVAGLDVDDQEKPVLQVPPVIQEPNAGNGNKYVYDYSHFLDPEDQKAGKTIHMYHTPGSYDNFMHIVLNNDDGGVLANGTKQPLLAERIHSGWGYPGASHWDYNNPGPGAHPALGRMHETNSPGHRWAYAKPEWKARVLEQMKRAFEHHRQLIHNGQLQAQSPEEKDSRFANLELAEKKLAKGVSEIPAGKFSRKGAFYDYSHVLGDDQRAAGYGLKVGKFLPSNQASVSAILTHNGKQVGYLAGAHSANRMRVDNAMINQEHRKKGLGIPMYEALYTHAKHKLGVNEIYGGSHSTAASKTHEALARKHGFEYKPNRVAEKPEGAFDGNFGDYSYALKSEVDPEGKFEEDDHDLEKSKLPMPKVPAHHHVTLPVGSQLNGKVKVQHSDGKQSWKQVESGMIMSQDPSQHPTSSRSPNSK